MNAIVSQTKTLCLQIRTTLDRAVRDIQSIRNPCEAKKLDSEFADLNQWMKMKSVQRALGDQFEDAKQKLAQLRVMLDLEKEKLAATTDNESLRRKAYDESGVPKSKIPILQQAARVPVDKRDSYMAAKANEKTLPKTEELAALARLPKSAQERAFAKIGDIASLQKIAPHIKSVAAVIKHEEHRAIKTWEPSSNKTAAPKVTEEHLASVALCQATRTMQQRLSEIFKIAALFQGDKSQAQILLAKRELNERLKSCGAKWDELNEIGSKLAQ